MTKRLSSAHASHDRRAACDSRDIRDPHAALARHVPRPGNPVPCRQSLARTEAIMPWFAWVLPTEAGIDLAADVWHEILGLVYYFVRGWYR